MNTVGSLRPRRPRRRLAARGPRYTTLADAWLAASMAADHQEARRLAREELSRVA